LISRKHILESGDESQLEHKSKRAKKISSESSIENQNCDAASNDETGGSEDDSEPESNENKEGAKNKVRTVLLSC
jgi:hypothetical protein